jgi:hypothetical protein
MTDSSVAYKYLIPLDTSGHGDSPTYSVPSGGDTLHLHYKATELVVVKTEAAPHFHKDSVNVEVEEVEKSEYT